MLELFSHSYVVSRQYCCLEIARLFWLFRPELLVNPTDPNFFGFRIYAAFLETLCMVGILRRELSALAWIILWGEELRGFLLKIVSTGEIFVLFGMILSRAPRVLLVLLKYCFKTILLFGGEK